MCAIRKLKEWPVIAMVQSRTLTLNYGKYGSKPTIEWIQMSRLGRSKTNPLSDICDMQSGSIWQSGPHETEDARSWLSTLGHARPGCIDFLSNMAWMGWLIKRTDSLVHRWRWNTSSSTLMIYTYLYNRLTIEHGKFGLGSSWQRWVFQIAEDQGKATTCFL